MKKVLKNMVVFGLVMFLSTTAIMAIQIPIQVASPEKLSVVWDVTLNVNESSGRYDYVVFGEAHDANDGPPADIYDEPKPPVPFPPYLRAWFDDDIPTPYHDLLEDCRVYPDTAKVWDLYVRWKSSDDTPINIDMTWDISEFVGIEYDDITLNRYNRSTEEWDFVVDMLTENNYTYAPEYFMEQWLIDHFQINAYVNSPPYVPGSPDPANGATDVDVDAVLVWSGGDPDPGDIVTYDVYFGNSSLPPLVASNLSDTSYDPGILDYSTTYYWKIVAWDNHNASAEGPIWNFTTHAQLYLRTTWNLIGLPTDVLLSKEDIIVRYNGVDYNWVNATTCNNPTGGPIVIGYIYYWNTSMPQHYGLSDVFEPGRGYWIYAYYNCTLFYPTTGTMQHMGRDNNAIAPLSDSLIECNRFDYMWNVTLEFTEIGGRYDTAFFGEAPDANDGPPFDAYDAMLPPPPPSPPYIRSWFDDGLPAPYNNLLIDYRHYPDTSKVWNLSVQWMPTDYQSPTDITISWDVNELDLSEYNSVVLYDISAISVVADMLIDKQYTFNASAMVPKDFQIICSISEPSIPDLNCDGSLSWVDVESGSTVTGSFIVENIGDSGSLLNWEVESFPDWGEWTIDPESGVGLTPEDFSVTVIVEVVAPDDQNTEFTGEIKTVNSDDPDDFCIIPVSLATPMNQNSVVLQFLERLSQHFPLLERIFSSRPFLDRIINLLDIMY